MFRIPVFIFLFMIHFLSGFSQRETEKEEWNNWMTTGINYTMLFTGEENNNRNYFGGGYDLILLSGRNPNSELNFFSYYKLYFRIVGTYIIEDEQLPVSLYCLGFSSAFGSGRGSRFLIPYGGCEIGLTQLGTIEKGPHFQAHGGVCFFAKERFQFYSELGYLLPLNEMDRFRGYCWVSTLSFKIRKNSRVGKIDFN